MYDQGHANPIISFYKNNATLWLGDIESSQDYKFLKNNNIKLVINCCAGERPPFALYNSLGINVYHLPIYDYDSESNNKILHMNINHVLQLIHNALSYGRNVLVHCHAGIQRSATVVACYLMRYVFPEQSLTYIIQYMRSKRPVVFNTYPTFNEFLNVYSYYISNKLFDYLTFKQFINS